MPILSAKEILELPDMVKLPSEILGGDVWVKRISIEDREAVADYFEATKAKDEGVRISGLWGLMIEKCIVNPDGSAMFMQEEVNQLKKKSENYFRELKRLVDEANPAPTTDKIKAAKENFG